MLKQATEGKGHADTRWIKSDIISLTKLKT